MIKTVSLSELGDGVSTQASKRNANKKKRFFPAFDFVCVYLYIYMVVVAFFLLTVCVCICIYIVVVGWSVDWALLYIQLNI